MTLKSNELYWTLFRPKYWAESSPGSKDRKKSAGAARRSITNLGDLGGADEQLGCVIPESLQLIKRASLRVEHVDYEIHEIEQDPPASIQPFDMVGMVAAAVQLFHHRLRDAADVCIGGAGCDDEVIGRVVQPTKIQYDEVTSLQILYGVQSQAKCLRRLRHRLPVCAWIANHPL